MNASTETRTTQPVDLATIEAEARALRQAYLTGLSERFANWMSDLYADLFKGKGTARSA